MRRKTFQNKLLQFAAGSKAPITPATLAAYCSIPLAEAGEHLQALTKGTGLALCPSEEQIDVYALAGREHLKGAFPEPPDRPMRDAIASAWHDVWRGFRDLPTNGQVFLGLLAVIVGLLVVIVAIDVVGSLGLSERR